jgi:glucokinase
MGGKKKKPKLVVGIDLGGTNMQIGVVDADDRIVGRKGKKTRAEEGSDRVIERLVKGIGQACEDGGVELDDIAAVGIASAGAIDIPRGVVLESPNLKWFDLPLKKILEKHLDRPVVVENDVNGAVWGEFKLGAGRDHETDDVLGVWVGTGVGGGLVIDGKLFYGEFFTAGEIGHTILMPQNPEGRRTVEDLCSRTGMARHIKHQLPQHPDSPVMQITEGTGQITGSKQFAQALEMGCDLTKEVVDEAADLLGLAIANQVTVLALDLVIVGGGVTEALGEPYVQRMRERFAKEVFPDRCRDCRIVATRLQGDAGLLGAALLAREAE